MEPHDDQVMGQGDGVAVELEQAGVREGGVGHGLENEDSRGGNLGQVQQQFVHGAGHLKDEYLPIESDRQL